MNPSSRHRLATALAAVAGLCLAVVLALLTSNLSTQRIGLAGESPSIGRSLVATPRPAKTDSARPAVRKRRKPKTDTATTPTQASGPSAPPAVAPAAADGGTSSSGSGSNGSGNDDARPDRETVETHTTEDTGETHTTETHTEPEDHPASKPDDDD